jgi:hypothetical protein
MNTAGFQDSIRPTIEEPYRPAAMMRTDPKQGTAAAGPGKSTPGLKNQPGSRTTFPRDSALKDAPFMLRYQGSSQQFPCTEREKIEGCCFIAHCNNRCRNKAYEECCPENKTQPLPTVSKYKREKHWKDKIKLFLNCERPSMKERTASARSIEIACLVPEIDVRE